MTELTEKQRKFVDEYMRVGVVVQAYRNVYDCSRMKDRTIATNAHKLFNNEKVNNAIRERQSKASEQSVFGVLEVLREWVDIATADPNKLIRHRRLNCRHCHGKGHAYQWRDRNEFAAALAEAIDLNAMRAKMRPAKTALELPDDDGGYDYAFNADPHPACPSCKGEGTEDVFIADTDKLTGKERKLYAGIKVTKNGTEVLMRSQDGALTNIAKALGMLTEKIKLVDPKEQTDAKAIPLDPVEAARVYQAMVKGDPT